MNKAVAPKLRKALRSGCATALLTALLFLNVFSDRLHRHPITEEGLGRCHSAGAPVSLLPASSPEDSGRRGLPCLACLHQRSPGLSPTAVLPSGRMVVLQREGPLPIPVPPPAPLPPPTGLRAPPLA